MIKFNVLLFNNFETLDAFGPAEIIGKLTQFYELEYYSESGGVITSSQNIRVLTLPLSKIQDHGILLIPGGMGTREEVEDQSLIESLTGIVEKSEFVLTVCTGTALLAKTGLLKQHKATTNKMAFDWVTDQDQDVQWIRKARWVRDQKYYSSSGVSAGMDMTLGFVRDQFGQEVAAKIAKGIEYLWNQDPENDPFAQI